MKLWFFIPIIMVVVGVSIAIILMNQRRTNENGESSQDETTQETTDPAGTIYVEGGEGTLVNGGTYSYIAESARGLEAYLGDESASAVYEFSSPTMGTYTLWVKLSDDGVHENGARSVTIVTNNSNTKKYNHISEDTKGWKWYKIGDIPLNEGSNQISFTKDEGTYAAYVMDEFKFVPVEE